MTSPVSLSPNTIYLFSCDKCSASQWKGSSYADYKVTKIPNSNDQFHDLFLEIGHKSFQISKGYYKYASQKITQLSQEEAKQIFGEHKCSEWQLLNSEPETPSPLNKRPSWTGSISPRNHDGKSPRKNGKFDFGK